MQNKTKRRLINLLFLLLAIPGFGLLYLVDWKASLGVALVVAAHQILELKGLYHGE
jgi:hypothetical protein